MTNDKERYIIDNALGDMAQLVERLVRNEEASGSNPLISTKKTLYYLGFSVCSPNVPQLISVIVVTDFVAKFGEFAPRIFIFLRKKDGYAHTSVTVFLCYFVSSYQRKYAAASSSWSLKRPTSVSYTRD